MKKFNRGKLTSGIEHEKRKRTYGSKIFMAGGSSRRHMNSQGSHPVKNYDFYDQPNDFEWFKGQGHNQYPYHKGMPAYSHEGYDDYQKPPDPHAVSQAMNLLEKHMTSSEALSSDNMFRNNEGRNHEHENDHIPMMNKIEDHGNYELGVNDINQDRYGDKHNEKFAMNQNDRHGGQERHNGGYDQHEHHNGDENQHEHEIQHGDENQQHSDKSGHEDSENTKDNMKEDKHMTEHYQWESVKGPELLHGDDLPSMQSQQEHREGWLPLKQHENSHGSPDRNDEDSHGPQTDHDENGHGPHGEHDENNQKSNHVETHETTYLDKEGKALKEQDKEKHGAGLETNGEGRVLNEVQKGKSEEEYIDFPQNPTNPSILKDGSNRNSMVDNSAVMNGPQQQNKVVQRQESAYNQYQSDHLNNDKIYENSDRQPNLANKIRINVGYPHYRVPNTHMEVAKNEPHQGPERGGGLWGNLPGVGEQQYGENSNQKNENAKLYTGSLSKMESDSDRSRSGKEEKNKEMTNARGAFDKNMQQEPHGNGMEEKQNNAKSSKTTRIPVTITTGVYDSREIFTIDRKKEYIHSKPVANKFKRREEIQQDICHSTRKLLKKRKKINVKGKHWNKNKREKRKGIKYLFSSTKIKKSLSKAPLRKKFAKSHKYKKTNIDQLSESDHDAEVPKRHGTGDDLDAVHGHPAISDEESLHSSPDELLDIANNLRHRAEEYDSKAKELENQAEIQDHQFNYHGSISQHHSHQGPERGGSQHGEEHEEEEHNEHNRIGPWTGPEWHGPGPFGTSHIKNENGHGSHGGGEGGDNRNGNEGGEEGHDDHVIHFNTGYPYYHVPKQHSLPVIEDEKPAPPVHGLNPYEVLTSEQFHRPMLPAGHGNLPYGHNQRTLHANSDTTEVTKKGIYMSRLSSKSADPGAVLQLPKYDEISKEALSDDNVNNFLLK